MPNNIHLIIGIKSFVLLQQVLLLLCWFLFVECSALRFADLDAKTAAPCKWSAFILSLVSLVPAFFIYFCLVVLVCLFCVSFVAVRFIPL